jgi:hypothetical protein
VRVIELGQLVRAFKIGKRKGGNKEGRGKIKGELVLKY